MSTDSLRRPLIGIVLTYAGGTWLGLAGHSPPFPPLAWVAAAGVVAGLCAVLPWKGPVRAPPSRTWNALRSGAVYMVVLLAAWLSAGVRGGGGPVPGGEPTGGERVELTGVVIGDVDVRAATGSGSRVREFPLRVEQWRSPGGEDRPARGARIRVRWYGPYGPARPSGRGGTRTPAYGERWRLSGSVRVWMPRGRARRYVTLHTGPRGSRFLSDGHGWGAAAWCYRTRRHAAAALAAGIEDYPGTVGILHALLLGYRSRLADDTRDVFTTTGTLHIFAISGLHVGIICWLLTFVLGACRVSRIYWVLFLGPLLAAYTLATGARPSAVRACIMVVVYYLAPLLGRRADAPSALAFAGLATLAVAPRQLCDTGFIFSFSVVAGLIAFYPRFEGVLRGLWRPDPLRLGLEARWVEWLRGAGRYACSVTAVSCSAWLVSAPLTAHFFGRFAPAALLGNLLVIPLAFAIVLTGCLSLVSGALLPVLGEVFNGTNLALVWLLVRSMEWVEKVPFGSVRCGRFPLWGLLCWYAVLSLFHLATAGSGDGGRAGPPENNRQEAGGVGS
jgi:ComEC/Rec2-related protein